MNISCFRDDVQPPRYNKPKEETASVLEDGKAETKHDTTPLEGSTSPKPQPLAFSIDFNEGKSVDMTKYENLMKRSQARHQRVQSMSASWQRSSPTGGSQTQRPPMSAKLPRKAHGYSSEGYFSSDQEDLAKTRTSQQKQSHNYNNNFSPGGTERDSFRNKHLKLDNYVMSNSSPSVEKRSPFERSPDSLSSSLSRKTKSPIVDSIMSRSDGLPSRQNLNLPLRNTHTSSLANNAYHSLQHTYPLRSPGIIEQSPEDAPMLADISSPELDMLTPDNVQLTPATPLQSSFRRNSSGGLRSFSPGPKVNKTSPAANTDHRLMTRSPSLNRKIAVKTKAEVEDDGNVSPSSTVSEAGTYTIEADHYTEEQKAKMNIDQLFGADQFQEPIMEALGKLNQPDEKKISSRDYVITKEPRFASGIREELLLAKTIPDTIRKVSTDKNVLEISCCYESPTESHQPPQIIKPNKTAKSYLDKIKNRVKNISEKTFQKGSKSHDNNSDVGSFTSVTASGVLSSNLQRNEEIKYKEKISRKNSLTKSQIDATEYVHHLPGNNLVVQTVSNESFVPMRGDGTTIMSSSHSEHPVCDEKSPEQMLVSKLSHISLNRCQGDKSWIQQWADSVKRHNKDAEMSPKPDLALTGLPPVSPRHAAVLKGLSSPVRSVSSVCSTPSKIPSPVSTLVRQRPPIPDILSSTPDTESYLASTQSVISNLQAKLQKAKSSQLDSAQDYMQILPDKCNNFTKLPVSQLSRSNSLNYRLHRRNDSLEGSPLRSPGNYYVSGTQALPASTRLLLANIGASKSLDIDPNLLRSTLSSPIRNRYETTQRRFEDKPDVIIGRMEIGKHNIDELKRHVRNRSFDGHNTRDIYETMRDYKNANMTRSLNMDSKDENNLIEKMNRENTRQRLIDLATNRRSSSPSNQILNSLRSSNHHRNSSDTISQINQANSKSVNLSTVLQGSPIKRSSSFNIVNKNNNDSRNNVTGSPVTRVTVKTKNLPQIASLQGRTNTPDMDYMSEDSDNISTGGFYSDYDRKGGRRSDANEVLTATKYNRAFALRRARLESPDLKSQQSVPTNSPRCPGTPELRRKFGNEQGSQTRQRAHSRDSRRPDTSSPSVQQSARGRNLKENSKQTTNNRLTRSSSTAKDFQPRTNDKSNKKQSPLLTNSKDVELQNWKKRSTYDPMKAAQEGRKRGGSGGTNARGQHVSQNTDISESSPVHRSRSFNCCGEAMTASDIPFVDQPSSDTEDDHPSINIMPGSQTSNGRSRQPQNTNITLSNEYVTKFQVNNCQENVVKRPSPCLNDPSKRVTHVIDHSDTNTGSSEPEDWEMEAHVQHNAAPVQVVKREKSRSVPPQQRHSGDFSVSSSTTTTTSQSKGITEAGGKGAGGRIQPRYLDISKYKSNEPSPAKNFLRRDPSKTYVAVLPTQHNARRNTAKQEQEMKVKELEKWRRRASYDPRKAAAQAKTKPASKSPRASTSRSHITEDKTIPPKPSVVEEDVDREYEANVSSVLRSQSFHGPMSQVTSSTKMSVMDRSAGDAFYQDASSDNEF